MRTIHAALALALAAAPAGAVQLVDVSAPQAVRAALPVLAPALPSALIATPGATAAAVPALPQAAAPGAIAPLQQASDSPLAALPSAATLQPLGVLSAEAPGAAAADSHRFSAGFDGTNGKLEAAPVDPSDPNGGGNGFSPLGSGSSSGGGSNPKSSALSRLISHIETKGQVRVINPQTGEAVKMIAPKMERTPNGGAMYLVVLTGTTDAQGNFTKTGVAAVRQTKDQSETALSATQTRRQDKQTGVQVAAALDGTPHAVHRFSSDHTDLIETVSHDPQAKAGDFQKEVADAQNILGAKDYKDLLIKIQQQGQLDLQGLLSGAGPRVIHELGRSQAPDGTNSQFVAILNLDAKGQPDKLSLVRVAVKSTPRAGGQGDTAREDTSIYVADAAGTLVEAKSVGKDHSLDIQESAGPADASAQTDFDGIVAKVSQP